MFTQLPLVSQFLGPKIEKQIAHGEFIHSFVDNSVKVKMEFTTVSGGGEATG